MTEPDWRRPHPLTVLVQIAMFLAQSGWPLLLAIGFGGGALGFDTIAVLAGTVTVGYGVLSWWMTGYAVTEETIEHRRGILDRKAQSLPLGRIQQVSVARPFLARVVGLAVVQVAEASADGNIEIRYLQSADADTLTADLRSRSRAAAPADDAPLADADGNAVSRLPPPPPPPAVQLHVAPVGALVRYHLASSAPALAVVAAIGFAIALAVAVREGPAPAAVVALIALGIMVTMAALSAVGAVFTFGTFTLERRGDVLTADMGLLSKRQVELQPARIQTVTVTSGLVARRLGLHEVRFSAATGKAVGKQQSVVHLAPVASTDEVARVVHRSVDVDPAFGVELEPVSPVTVRRMLVRTAVAFVLVGIPAAVGVGFVHPVGSVALVALWWSVAIWFARARHARLGFSLDDRRLVVRRGVFQHHLTQLPVGNVQAVETIASFFQRRLGVADLVVTTAGIGPAHHVRVPDLPANRAAALRSSLAATAADRSWDAAG
ncbi:MAG: PH domain-containing protein [Acidimicrobiales bacterium]|nr:PH domain-containing protein [Acidimicrobiales bacterium]